MSADIIQLNPEAFQTELKSLVKNSIEETLNAMLDEEAKKLVNAERYAREEERNGYRAGHYDRKFYYHCRRGQSEDAQIERRNL